MGWVVEVEALTGCQAVCHEGLAVWPLPPGHEGPQLARCGWRGPERGRWEDAEEDAAEHRRQHADGWRRYNHEIDRQNGEPWAHTVECDVDAVCSCGADERERAMA